MEYEYGTITRIKGNFGFISRSDGSEMFVLPNSCASFGGIPAIGTPVKFTVTTDAKTGRPRADSVEPAEEYGTAGGQDSAEWLLEDQDLEHLLRSREGPGKQVRQTLAAAGQQIGFGSDAEGMEKQTGEVIKHRNNKFGFIKQDSDGVEMFFMPGACAAFGNELPPIGTRVMYIVVPDSKTGRDRAESVEPEAGYLPEPVYQQPKAVWQAPAHSRVQIPVASGGGIDLFSGTQGKGAGKSNGKGSGKSNGKGSGKAAVAMAAAGLTGTLIRSKGNFGFIEQDNGEEMMFVMPVACAAFGGTIPPIGTRVSYEVVVDAKTGRPRADNVLPESHAIDCFGPAKGVYGNPNAPVYVAPGRSPYS